MRLALFASFILLPRSASGFAIFAIGGGGGCGGGETDGGRRRVGLANDDVVVPSRVPSQSSHRALGSTARDDDDDDHGTTTLTSTSTASIDDIDRTTTIPPPSSSSTIPLLPPHTLAGRVERALLSRFPPHTASTDDDGGGIGRVLSSWRYLDAGYDHREYVGDQQPSPPDASENDRKVSRCYQHAPSYVPGLRARAWWDVPRDLGGDGKWVDSLSKSYGAIRDEFTNVISGGGGDVNNPWAKALTSDAESYGVSFPPLLFVIFASSWVCFLASSHVVHPLFGRAKNDPIYYIYIYRYIENTRQEGWRTLVLLNRGQWDDDNARLFPVTSRAIRDSGVPVVEAFFASMEPHSVIKPHSDFTNFVLTCHLPLVVPENGSGKCRLTVGDETRQWLQGQVSLFDTSIYHDAINESDSVRYILMMRVWHPDLSLVERDALQFVYDCLEVPDLLSRDENVAAEANRLAISMREFPLALKGGGGGGGGFGGGGSGGGRRRRTGGSGGGGGDSARNINDGGGSLTTGKAKMKGGGGKGFGQ